MTYQRPGVYISERVLPAPIAATGTANAAGALVAELAQGPTAVTLVSTWYDFVKLYGGYNAAFPATFSVGQYFQNGGGDLYVRRVLHDDAGAASVSIPKGVGVGSIGSISAKTLGADGNNLRVQITKGSNGWNVTVYKEGVAGTSSNVSNDIVLEVFNNLVFDDATSTSFVNTVTNLESQYVLFNVTDTTVVPSTAVLPLTGGTNGTAVTEADYEAVLGDFDIIERPLVFFGGEVLHANALGAVDGATFLSSLVTYVGTGKNFVIVDVPAGTSVATAITSVPVSKNAAAYYPSYYINDPVGRSSASIRLIGPSGAMAGIYLATDRAKGPFKAPAGTGSRIAGAVALESSLTSAQLDILNTGLNGDTVGSPINAIRNVTGAGIVPMGTRTLLDDGTADRYLNMRRSLIYIKSNLELITQFALFENNNEALWSRIATVITVFLNQYRNVGGLRGSTPAQAFYVKIDSQNNTAATIAAGQVNIEVGVALQYPAEFIVINLSQKTAV